MPYSINEYSPHNKTFFSKCILSFSPHSVSLISGLAFKSSQTLPFPSVCRTMPPALRLPWTEWGRGSSESSQKKRGTQIPPNLNGWRKTSFPRLLWKLQLERKMWPSNAYWKVRFPFSFPQHRRCWDPASSGYSDFSSFSLASEPRHVWEARWGTLLRIIES